MMTQEELAEIQGTFNVLYEKETAPTQMQRLLDDMIEWRLRARNLIERMEGPWIPCKGCGAMVKFVKHKTGANPPYTQDALNHFIDCPKRKEFKKP